jgi:hypothetical protein
MQLIEKLPDAFHPKEGDPIPSQLIGAKIIRIGTLEEGSHMEGGGLVIEYMPDSDKSSRRIILEFTELGMWVNSDIAI